MKMILLYSGVLLMCTTFGFGQDVQVSEDFTTGLPHKWSVETNNTERKWQENSFKDNFYIQMSAYGGKGQPVYNVRTQLHTPKLNTKSKTCKLKFHFADAFKNGNPLKVHLVDDVKNEISILPNDAWENLVNNSGFYDNVFEETEWISLPQMENDSKVVFIYDSDEGKISTTIQLGEVKVWCEQ